MQKVGARHGIDSSFWLGECLIEPALARVTRGETCTTLEARQLRLLLLLAAHSGELLSYEAIERHVWPESQPDRETLFHCVSQLRRALGDAPRAPRHIKTVPGQGYLLISRLRLLATASVGASQRPAVLSSGKWRWWLGVGTLLLLACTLIVLHVSQHEQRRTTARERNSAEQVSRLMVGSFPLEEPRSGATYQPVMAADLLIRSEQRLLVDLAEQPQLQAQMLHTIGTTYLRQKRFEQAFAALQRTRSLYDGPGKGSPLQFAKVNSALSTTARELGRINEALGYLFEAAENLRTADRSRSREYARMLADRGALSDRLGQPEKALRYYNAALQLSNELEGDNSSSSAGILGDMSHLYLWIDDPATAERVARKSVSIYRSSLPPLHPERIMAEAQLAEILPYQGRLREAEELLGSTLDNRRQLFGTEGSLIAASLIDFGHLQMLQQRWAQAESFLRQAITAHTAVNQQPTHELVNMETALGVTVLNQGRAHEAVALLSDAIAIHEKTKPHLYYLASAEHFLGEAQLAVGDFNAAEQTLNLAIQHLGSAGATPWRMARSRNTLGEVLLRTGRRSQGIKVLRESQRQLLQDRTADGVAQEQATERLERLLGRAKRVRRVDGL